MPDRIRCQNCGKEVPAKDIFPSEGKPLSEFTVGYYQSMTYSETFPTEGKILCEDCYIDNAHRVRICDLWGERSKRIFRESHGLEGTEGLTDLQKEIYEYVVALGSATVEEIAEKFNVHQTDLENQLATLKHCQLLKGKREGDMAYIVPW